METKLKEISDFIKNAKINERYNFDYTGNVTTSFIVLGMENGNIRIQFTCGSYGILKCGVVVYEQPFSPLEKELM